MKPTTQTLALLSILTALAGCGGAGGTGLPADGEKSAKESEMVRSGATRELSAEKGQHVVHGGNEFGMKIFKNLATATKSNLLYSPISLNMALGMAVNGAAGDTKLQMVKAMGVAGLVDDDRNAVYKSLVLLAANIDPKVELEIANSIWVDKGIEFEPKFLKTNEDHFGATASAIDLQNPSALETINGWVNNKTKGRIPTILDRIPDNAGAYLINAIYFKGRWKEPFSKDNTHEADFNVSASEVSKVQMMNRRGDCAYYEDDGGQLIRLPYASGRLGLLVYLPKEGASLNATLETLTAEKLLAMQTGAKVGEVDISLPRFSFSSQFALKESLAGLGMNDAFSPAKANFSQMRSKDGLFLQDVIQKTWIQVDEEGTEASAATSVEVGVTSIRVVPHFLANRPFLFAIEDQESHEIFFLGLVRDPKAG